MIQRAVRYYCRSDCFGHRRSIQRSGAGFLQRQNFQYYRRLFGGRFLRSLRPGDRAPFLSILPGNPTRVVENMTGAGGIIAANHLYNSAKPDGLTIGAWASPLVLQHIMGNDAVQVRRP